MSDQKDWTLHYQALADNSPHLLITEDWFKMLVSYLAHVLGVKFAFSTE